MLHVLVKNGLKQLRSKYYAIMEAAVISVSPEKRKSEVLSPEEDDNGQVKKLKTDDSTVPVSEETIPVKPVPINRIRKPKKSAVLLCYLGKNYYGMQKNHGVRTVEEDLFKALLKANIIIKEEFENTKMMKFQRAARTDKGVSAIRQTISMKVPLNDICESFPSKVNQHLPPEIKILGVKRVTQAFDAKISCDARTYSYMVPTFAFCDSQVDHCEDYRIPEERIQTVNELLQTYLGTHNFFNFTSGRAADDASCKRYIMSVQCGQPFISEGLQFVIIKIKGQSFMLHQIRKMIGLVIAISRKLVTSSEIFEKVWKSDRVDIPMAPGLGLMLEEVHYDWYNKKYGGDGMHEALIWDTCQDEINAFREEQIHKNIALTEKEEKSMLQWLETLPYHSFDYRDPAPPTLLPEKKEEIVNEENG